MLYEVITNRFADLVQSVLPGLAGLANTQRQQLRSPGLQGISPGLQQRGPHAGMTGLPGRKGLLCEIGGLIDLGWSGGADLAHRPGRRLGFIYRPERFAKQECTTDERPCRITSYNVCYTKLLRIFNEFPYFMSEEFSQVDCYMAPLLWRLPQLGIELTGKGAKELKGYMTRLFERDSFQASLTDVEREVRGGF